MYQFYYAQGAHPRPVFQQNIRDLFQVTALRPTMWEEHCLECSAPVCYRSCVHYIARSDGRCKRFHDGLGVYPEEKGCCGEAVHVRFRKWANMMTIIFPAMLGEGEYRELRDQNIRLGNTLRKITGSRLPQALRWQSIRALEWLRRRSLRRDVRENIQPDAFLFQGYSHQKEAFRLILEVYNDHDPVFKTSLDILPGENLKILGRQDLSAACWEPGHLVKIYPENDVEAELTILWCDFVQGKPLDQEKPAAKVKCVVWDLDNTLWNGTLIETEDPASLKLNPGVLETIRELDRRGVIQSIASKNTFDAAWPVVEGLGLSDFFLYPQIHWGAKSRSLEQIAKSLNIGVDSFAFVDDSHFEREQVRSVLPQARVFDPVELPDLLTRPEFQLPVTQESRNRRAMYRAEEKRTALMLSDSDDTVTFLRKCHLRITPFSPAAQADLTRCYELIARTNQLNMSGRKYSQEEFQQVLLREGHRNIAFSCQDDFGSYGTVGFAQYRVEAETLVFTEFAMSCRVAGKYVESAFFAHLLGREGCREGRFPVVKTKKNILLRNTLAQIGCESQEETSSHVGFRFTKDLKHADAVLVDTAE